MVDNDISGNIIYFFPKYPQQINGGGGGLAAISGGLAVIGSGGLGLLSMVGWPSAAISGGSVTVGSSSMTVFKGLAAINGGPAAVAAAV